MERQASMIRTPENTLRFLLVSDIHLAFDNLDKLLKLEEKSSQKIDFVLGSGDFGNINHEVAEEDTKCESVLEMIEKKHESLTEEKKEEELTAEGEIAMVLQGIEDRVPGKPPIYYIPGNHDPKPMFFKKEQRPTLTLNSANLHNGWVEIKPDLALVALGGSVSSYLHKHGENFSDSKPIYQPYPYFNDELFKKDLDALLAQVTSKQIILMTHDGPQGSATALDKTTRIEEGNIVFGSPYLYEVLKKDAGQRIIANIHGHAHDGAPADKITDGVRVFNPGSLKFAECAELTLRLDPVTRLWKVDEFLKHYMA